MYLPLESTAAYCVRERSSVRLECLKANYNINASNQIHPLNINGWMGWKFRGKRLMLLPLYPGCSIKDKWKINNTGQGRITKNTKVFQYLHYLFDVLDLKEREGPLWIIG